MRPGQVLRAMVLLLALAAAGCYQPAGSDPRELALEIQQLPSSRSELVLTRRATGDLPLTVIAPTLRGDAPPTPTLLVAPDDAAFITPRGPDVPAREAGGGSGFTTFSLPTPTATLRPPGVDEVSPECVHEVRGGDTLYGIALQNDSTVDAMLRANPSLSRDNTVIYPGQRLLIASCPELQHLFPTATALPPRPTAVVIVVTSPPAGYRVHVVRSGDTMYTIALNYGVSTAALLAANNLPDPDRLEVGQEILIPPRN